MVCSFFMCLKSPTLNEIYFCDRFIEKVILLQSSPIYEPKNAIINKKRWKS